ncbi:AAA family ATPase [Thioalkalivibrio denitrificans]|uniref:AAA family ATPase n=1 Tax=Thioalkalivibrio denitrificans TaxID=108003 RepID=A0A1V3NHN4_9GAMM|nr:ATP-binding protein [Thioalkalivibrio denitrificans]OOG24565.1 AAA family ATPase [Thioalkalivibrio denitrificans]
MTHDIELKDVLEQFSRLMDRAERLLPVPPPDPDWSAPAHRWHRDGHLSPVHEIAPLSLDDLLHIERQKAQLVRNTRQFLKHLPANNVLLWGSRGTGKSSLMRALLNEFRHDGLRIIQVDGHDLVHLPDIARPLAGRPERFIVLADDLSFEASDPGYKALKAMLDGSLEGTPENVLIHATSNRRHLMPEKMMDNLEVKRVDDEIHPGEAVEEKISLSERFGLWLAFHPFNQEQYLAVVNHWLTRLGCIETEESRAEALRYALGRGSRSGRVAWQFARDWAGQKGLEIGG